VTFGRERTFGSDGYGERTEYFGVSFFWGNKLLPKVLGELLVVTIRELVNKKKIEPVSLTQNHEHI